MKRVFTLLTAALTIVSISAQSEKSSPNYTEKWNDNIFISAGGGASIGLRNGNYGNGFWRAVNPTINIALGKYINPLWSYRLQTNGSWRMSLRDANTGIRDKQEYLNIGMDALFNLTNAFLGYDPSEKLEVSVFGGPYANLTISNGFDAWRPGVSAGLQTKYNLNKYLSVDLEGRMGANRDINIKKKETWYGELSLGVSYIFNGKEFKNCNKHDLCLAEQKVLNDQINADKNQITDLQNQLAAAKQIKPTEVVKVVTKKCDDASGPIVLFFQIGKADINDQGKANIQLAAKAIKADPNGIYCVTGYTDKATGTPELNKKLSELRANNVYNALVAEGINVSQLEKVAMGAQENLFSSDALNRVVIVKRK